MIFFDFFANATSSSGCKRKMAKMSGGGVGFPDAPEGAGVKGQVSEVRVNFSKTFNIQRPTFNVEGPKAAILDRMAGWQAGWQDGQD
jgi:hypothetical protein